MNLKKLITISIIFLSVTACKVTINGAIEVQEALSFNQKKSSKPQIEVTPGKYAAVLTFKSKKKMYLTIKNNNETPVLFKIPKGKTIPETSGYFTLTQEESKQPYELEANIETIKTNSEVVRRSESCSETSYHNVCSYDHDGHRVCYMDSYEQYGVRVVEGYTKYTTKLVTADLLEPTTKNILARFEGKDVKARFVRSYYGPCYAGGYGRGGFGHY